MEPRPGPEDASTSRLSAHPHFPSAPRVSQVDAEELDEGLVGMLAEKVERSMGNIRNDLGVDLKPEISLILKLIVFRLSYFGPLGGSSPGARLQNLRMVHDSKNGSSTRVPRKLLLLYLLLNPPILPTYILTRLRNRALSQQWPDLPSHDWRRKAWKVIVRLEECARIWELAGWGAFLWDGKYPSLLMRILRLRLVPASAHLQKLVSYEFMNRQLVWSAFTEFMMFSIPLLPPIPAYLAPRSLLSPITALVARPTKIDYASIPLVPSLGSKNDPSHPISGIPTGPFANLPLETCPICHLRQTAVPRPLDSVGAGSDIALPPISGSGQEEAGGSEGHEETRIFVPAQTDCWAGCKWCYYCIGEELFKDHEGVSRRRKEKSVGPDVRAEGKGDFPGEKRKMVAVKEVEEGWGCLRCGGSVSRAWRVGAESKGTVEGRILGTESALEPIDEDGDA